MEVNQDNLEWVEEDTTVNQENTMPQKYDIPQSEEDFVKQQQGLVFEDTRNPLQRTIDEGVAYLQTKSPVDNKSISERISKPLEALSIASLFIPASVAGKGALLAGQETLVATSAFNDAIAQGKDAKEAGLDALQAVGLDIGTMGAFKLGKVALNNGAEFIRRLSANKSNEALQKYVAENKDIWFRPTEKVKLEDIKIKEKNLPDKAKEIYKTLKEATKTKVKTVQEAYTNFSNEYNALQTKYGKKIESLKDDIAKTGYRVKVPLDGFKLESDEAFKNIYRAEKMNPGQFKDEIAFKDEIEKLLKADVNTTSGVVNTWKPSISYDELLDLSAKVESHPIFTKIANKAKPDKYDAEIYKIRDLVNKYKDDYINGLASHTTKEGGKAKELVDTLKKYADLKYIERATGRKIRDTDKALEAFALSTRPGKDRIFQAYERLFSPNTLKDMVSTAFMDDNAFKSLPELGRRVAQSGTTTMGLAGSLIGSKLQGISTRLSGAKQDFTRTGSNLGRVVSETYEKIRPIGSYKTSTGRAIVDSSEQE